MIPCPPGWTERRSGDSSLLVPRAGTMAILVDQRVAPLRTMRAITTELCARHPEFTPQRASAVEPFVTLEGEHAAAFTLSGTERGNKVVHAIAVVYADDFYNCFDGRAAAEDAPELEGIVIDVARRHRLYLGVRRRRFGFRPVSDWHIVGGLYLDVAMFPPDYPKRVSVVQVWAAQPIALETEAAIDEMDRQDREAGLTLEPGQGLGASPMRTPRLIGQEWRRTLVGPGGLRFVRQMIELRDNIYAYRMRLDAVDHDRLSVHRLQFAELVGSVEPVPAAQLATPAAKDTTAASEMSQLWGIE